MFNIQTSSLKAFDLQYFDVQSFGIRQAFICQEFFCQALRLQAVGLKSLVHSLQTKARQLETSDKKQTIKSNMTGVVIS